MEDAHTVKIALIKGPKEDTIVRIVKPSRKWVMEPLLFYYALFTMPFAMSRSQFVLQKIARSMFASLAAVNFKTNLNSSSTCNVNKSSSEFILQQEIESAASYMIMQMALVYSASGIVSAMYLCSLSDKRGRRYALIPATIGDALQSFCIIIVDYFDLDIHYLFIGEFIGGLGGGWETLLVASFAYIADITSPKDRGLRIVVLELSILLSMGLVSVFTGYLIHYIGFLSIFIMISGGKFCGLMYVIFFVPETIQPLQRVTFWSLNHFKHSFRIFEKTSIDSKKNQKFVFLFIAFFFSSIVLVNLGIDTLFQMNSPLCWNSIQIGMLCILFFKTAN